MSWSTTSACVELQDLVSMTRDMRKISEANVIHTDPIPAMILRAMRNIWLTLAAMGDNIVATVEINIKLANIHFPPYFSARTPPGT